LEEVILYSEITEVLTLGLISESIHSIVGSKTLQREYLSSYTRFNIELLRPWIGYFDDFPDDDFEYHLYSFVRDYIRRVCYHLSGRDLLSLYIMSADIDVIIFIIDYGDIAEMSLSMLMLRLKAEEDNPLPQIMNRLFTNDDHFEASDVARIKEAVLLNTSTHYIHGTVCQRIHEINSYFPIEPGRYYKLGDVNQCRMGLMAYELLDLHQNAQYNNVFVRLISNIVEFEDQLDNYQNELRVEVEHIIDLMVNFIHGTLKSKNGASIIPDHSMIQSVINCFKDKLTMPRTSIACEPLFHHPRLNPITQELVEVHVLGLDI